MKLWNVEWFTAFSSHIYSELFFTEREADEFIEERCAASYAKKYQVEDIWHFAARNFERVISDIIEKRTSDDGNVSIWNDEDVSIDEEIEALAGELGIKQFSCERWETFENPGIDVYAFSAAWVYDGELHHYTDTLEVF